MAEKLSIQIELAGGAEIERQLADIGKAGEKAFLDIARSAQQAGGFKNLKPEEVTAKLKEMGIVGQDAIDKISGTVATATRYQRLADGVRAAETAFKALGVGVVGLARLFGPLGVAAAAAFTVVIKAAGEAAEAIGKVDQAAAKAGLSIQKYDQLRAALEKGGVSAAGVAEAIGKISEATDKVKLKNIADDLKALQEGSKGGVAFQQLLRLQDAAKGVGPAADAAREALNKLGISWSGQTSSLEKLASGTSSAGETLRAFIGQLEGIADPAERNKIAFQQMGAAGLEIARGISTGAISSKQSIEELTRNVTLLSDAGADSAARLTQSFNQSAAAWERFKTTGDASQLGIILAEMASRVSISFGIIGQELGVLGGKIAELGSAIGGVVWDAFSSAGTTAINSVIAGIDFLIGKLREAAQWAAKVFSGSGASAGTGSTMPGFAAGGTVGGRGTGTSDSNLAWVSRGEHIMPARAVSQPGVLSFLEALRRSGGNLSRVLDRMGHFALGGPVGLPAFAAGGSIGSMSHVTIQFPGLDPIGGLRASAGVVDELRKAAAMAQVRSGGRKPSRYT